MRDDFSVSIPANSEQDVSVGRPWKFGAVISIGVYGSSDITWTLRDASDVPFMNQNPIATSPSFNFAELVPVEAIAEREWQLLIKNKNATTSQTVRIIVEWV